MCGRGCISAGAVDYLSTKSEVGNLSSVLGPNQIVQMSTGRTNVPTDSESDKPFKPIS